MDDYLSIALVLVYFLFCFVTKIIEAAICMIIGTALSPVSPLITMLVIDKALGGKDISLLVLLVIAGVVLFVFSSIIGFIRGYLFLIMGQKVIFDVRLDFYQHVQRLPIEFFRKMQVGDLMSRILSDVRDFRSLLADTFLSIIRNVLTLLIASVIMFILHWKLALICFIGVPLYLFIYKNIKKRTRIFSRMKSDKWANLNSLVQTQIHGIQTIKTFAQEKMEAINFVRRSKEVIEIGTKEAIFGSVSGMVTGGLGIIVPTLISLYGGSEVIRGNLTLGQLVAFTSLMGYISGPMKGLFGTNIGIQAALASLERVMEVWEIPQEGENIETVDAAGTSAMPFNNIKHIRKASPEINGHLLFENVSFAYIPNEYVLKNITCEVEHGEVLGVIGPSGAGKTTLSTLINRLHEPTEGRIFLDGVDLRHFELKHLRQNIGIVPQETYLFPGSIRSNIAYAKPKSTMKDIEFAVQIANIHDFIVNLPLGYETEVGEKGVRLSAGQKQRICIARMIIASPKIAILDEATSFLDLQTETNVYKNLISWYKRMGITMIIISHRLSAMRHVDKIIVLNDGGIIEQGTHESLYRANGLYKKLYDRQS